MPEEDSLIFSDLKEILDRITSRLVESSDPGALFDAVVQIAMDTTDAQASSLYLEQSDEVQPGVPPTIIMVAGAGYEIHRIGKAMYKKGEGLTGSIWEKSTSVKFDSAEEVENRKGAWRGTFNHLIHEKVPNWTCSSLIGVPLTIGVRTIGVIKVENKNPGPPAHFSHRDHLVLKLIASTMALAIENRRLSEKTYSSILSALREVSDMLVSKDIIPFSALCEQIVRKCVEIFNAQACSLYLETPGSDSHSAAPTITMLAGAGYELHRIGRATYHKGEGLTGSIWQQSASVKFDTTAEVENAKGSWRGVYNDIIRKAVLNWTCSSLIGVPLRIGNRTIGVIKVENKNPAPHAHFSHEELRTLEILASNIALALEMLNRHREIFLQGERARGFMHNVANQIKNALFNVQESNKELRQSPNATKVTRVQERLLIVERDLFNFDQLRKQTQREESTSRHHVPMDIVSVVDDLLRRLDKILSQNQIDLRYEPPEQSLFINVDREQILQALGNIVSNSIEALANKDRPEICIDIQHRPTSKEVAIVISDNGPGLPPGSSDSIRLGRPIRSTRHLGLGTGLPEAIRCITENDGRFAVVDLLPTKPGTCFEVVIPTCDPSFLHLAVVDDHLEFIETLRVALQDRENISFKHIGNHELLLADTDASADLRSADFILLDCHWSTGLDGIQIYRELTKALNPLADKILLMSGHEQFLSDPGVYDKYEDIIKRLDEFVGTLYGKKG